MTITPHCEIDFSSYRELLGALLPSGFLIAVTDAGGQTIWHDSEFPLGALSSVPADLSATLAGVTVGGAPIPVRSETGRLFASPVTDETSKHYAVLWAFAPGEGHPPEALRWLGTVAEHLGKDLMLNAELDDMASELSERYEELNLVYHTEDQVNYFGEGWAALNQLVRNCCDYLDVGLAVLVVKEKGILISQQSRDRTVPDAKLLTELVQDRVFGSIARKNAPLIVDDLSGSDLVANWQGNSYRLLATPIFDDKEETIGVLAIVNSYAKPRFANSDKNLVQVMARKANKILHVSYDNLTGLVNRQGLDFIANELLQDARALGMTHTVLHIDIDQLHVINDTICQEAGDAVIRSMAAYLRQTTRETDVVCRIGGDEMAVLLRRCPLERGAELADKLRQGIADLVVPWEDRTLTTTASIGVAPIEAQTVSAQAALAAAELACDAAKELGNNRVHRFHTGDSMLMKRHSEMEAVGRIQSAIKDDRFELFAQPIAPLDSNAAGMHLEVLIRLIGLDGEIVPPGAFIPAAERYHLMPELDRWVIQSLFSELSRNRSQIQDQLDLISVNLSGQTLNEQSFGQWLAEALGRLDFPHSRICFEITETAAVANLEDASAFMRTIKQHGCKFALDDFGSGLSSFGYLRSLPVDFLKIDGAIVKEVVNDPIAASMVAAVQQVAAVMDLETIAEFVESDAIKQKLREIGVSYVQGYAIGRPKPLSACLYGEIAGSKALSA
ncbi:MAG: EAL domain-containing protein [Gammaproteobacteria bacterium]|nr:EAL domain-containing protein [Gammaproteobacteria bacterium]MDH3507294.1 EAL domain-containing protein [Gammaproteobacteria bacterium]